MDRTFCSFLPGKATLPFVGQNLSQMHLQEARTSAAHVHLWSLTVTTTKIEGTKQEADEHCLFFLRSWNIHKGMTHLLLDLCPQLSEEILECFVFGLKLGTPLRIHKGLIKTSKFLVSLSPAKPGFHITWISIES